MDWNILGWGTLVALGGGLAIAYRHVRSVFDRLVGLVVLRSHIHGTVGTWGLLSVLQDDGWILKPNGRTFFVWYAPRGKEYLPVAAEFWKPGGFFLAFYKKHPLWIEVKKNFQGVVIYSFRYGFNIDDVIVKSVNTYQSLHQSVATDEVHSRFYVNRFTGTHKRAALAAAKAVPSSGRGPDTQGDHGNYGYGTEDTNPDTFYEIPDGIRSRVSRLLGDLTPADLTPNVKGLKPFDTFILSEQQEELLEEAKYWLDSRDWYVNRGIPWRRGWLLSGEPGVGKTAFIRSLAMELDLPIMAFDLASMDNDEFISFWTEAQSYAPAIILLEDLDAVFHGRENHTEGHLTFDCLLNQLDGVKENYGLFLVVTTNNIQHMDDAIRSRPARVDRCVEFGPLDLKCRLKVANNILREYPELAKKLAEEVEEPIVAAAFQEICVKMALELHFKDRGQEQHDCPVKFPVEFAKRVAHLGEAS